jgi:hypothetical protein
VIEMPGQHKTRRGAGGRIEKIPEDDPQRTPPLPAAEPPPLPREEEAPFIREFREEEAEPEVQAAPPEKEGGGGVSGAIQGAFLGGKAGPIGAAVGAATGFLLGQSSPKPIGTLEGGSVQDRDDETKQTLQAMLELQQKVARVGTPIKDQVTTQAAGSRW